MARRLHDIRLAVLMLDAIELKGRCCVVALGITTDGIKVPLGLWDGSTENKTVTAHLLSDLVHRGLDVEQGVLVVLDGPRRCGPRSTRCSARRRCSAASATRSATCSSTCPSATARRSRRGCAARGPDDHGSRSTAARSPPSSTVPPRRRRVAQGGPEETLTLTRLRIRGRLKRTLSRRTHRVDDRDRPPHQPQRQALAIRRHVPALDRRRHARSRAAVPQSHRLQRPRQARDRGRARPHRPARPSPPRPPRRPPRSPPPDNITPGPPSRSSTTDGTTRTTSAVASHTHKRRVADSGKDRVQLCGVERCHA